MKKFILSLVLFSAGWLMLSAQAQVSINVNIGNQPVWGPAGYDYVDYYYLPDIEAYYNVPRRQFVYFDMGRWVFSTGLPYRYRNYDLYNGYKVVINHPDAYRYWSDHRVRYSNYRNWGGRRQVIIRDRSNYRKQVVYRQQPQRVVYNQRNVYVNDRNRYDTKRYKDKKYRVEDRNRVRYSSHGNNQPRADYTRGGNNRGDGNRDNGNSNRERGNSGRGR